MMLLSCVNCCHNPLQTDSVGTSVGFCTEHRKVLLAASQLTCGRHLRKDLTAPRAIGERAGHEARFSPAMIARLTERKRPANGGYTSDARDDIHQLASDPVGEAILDYGRLASKIGSLAQLRNLPGARPEAAMLSLARAYVNRCTDRGGLWTSGIHLLWWTRRRLLDEPELDVNDLRAESPAGLSRQVELAQWSLIMMRLVFISDVGYYARSHDVKVARLSSLAERAAEATGDLSPRRLLGWLRREGSKLVDRALSEDRYEALSAELRDESSTE